MTHVHIVEPYHSSAMGRMTQPLLDYFPEHFEHVTTGEESNDSADINYHIPWHTLNGLGESKSLQVALYTHVNPPAVPSLVEACSRADHIVAMSETGKNELTALGIHGDKITVITAGHTDYAPRRQRIGIVGYEQPNGRKRGHILLDLCWLMDVTPFHFLFTGAGWGDTITKMQNSGAAVTDLGDLPQDKLQDVYSAIDLLLVTSYIEGGPLTVLEALSAGLPVIAPPVGYAADLLPKKYIYRNVEELAKRLEQFIKPIADRQKMVSGYTWKKYSRQHAELFERLLCLPTFTQTETVTNKPSYTE